MNPTNRPNTTATDRTAVGSSASSAKLVEETTALTPIELDSQTVTSPPVRRRQRWQRAGGIGLLGFGIIAGVFLILHNESVQKQQALNAAQANKSSQVKSQSIGLSNLGLKAINGLQEQSGTLTVNGQVDVTDSVVLEPVSKPQTAVAGQLYFDQQQNKLAYYNGSNFFYLQGGVGAGNNVNNISNVYNVYNVSNISNISNFTNTVTGPLGVIPMFNGSGLSDSLINETGNGVGVGTAADTATRLTIAGNTSDGTTSALTITNNTGDVYEQISDNGLINLGKGPSPLFGNPTVEPTKDTGINGIISADKFTTSGSTTITSMSVYVDSVGAAPYNEYQLGIYADNGGAPGAWIASSAVGTLTANTWNTLPVSATLAAGTSYWLAYTTSSNNTNNDDPRYAITSAPTHAYATFSFGSGSKSGMPASYPSPTTVNDYTHSIYATVLGTGSALTVDSSGGLTANGTATFKDINPSLTAFQVQNSGGSPVLNVDTTDSSVSVGTATSTVARLTVVGATNDSTTNALSVQSSTGVTLAQVGDDGSVNLGESHATFGSASSGNYTGGGYYNAGNELLQAQSFTTTSGGSISSISTYIGQAIAPSPNNAYQMAIYSDATGKPGTIIASTNVGTLAGSGWNTLPITATLSASTKYWLVYWTNVTDGNHNGQNFISGYAGPNTFYQAFAAWQSGASNGMPTTFPSGTGPSSGYETSIYATYAAPITALSMNASGDLTSNGTLLIQNSSSSALDVTDATGGTALYVDGGSHFVGVNTSNTNGFNFVVNGTSAFGGVNNTQDFRVVNALGLALLNADTSGLILTVGGSSTAFATLLLNNAHVSSTQTTAPTISTPLNCGTTPSASVTAGSTDSAGSFSLTAGTGTITGPCTTTITFNQTYGATAPKSVLVTPTTAIGTSPQGAIGVVSAVAPDSFTVTLPTNPAAGAVNSYYYWVIE